MKTTNYGSPYEKRITLRLTENQMTWLCNVADSLGITPSEYVRMTINLGMREVPKYCEGSNAVCENAKTDKHDKL